MISSPLLALLSFSATYYTISKNACLQEHFCAAVNSAVCGTRTAAQPQKLAQRAFSATYYTPFYSKVKEIPTKNGTSARLANVPQLYHQESVRVCLKTAARRPFTVLTGSLTQRKRKSASQNRISDDSLSATPRFLHVQIRPKSPDPALSSEGLPQHWQEC